MGGSQKSKRITWAPDVNLCQVRLFSSVKPPSEVGIGSDEDESLPPGFENMKPTILKLPRTPLTKWRCPPRFQVIREWQVVSGEESKEIEFQKQRERRSLEAIYPRPSTIPPNPRLPLNVEQSISDEDPTIPLIPLTPIEDADAGVASSVANTSLIIPQPQHQLQSGDQCSSADNIAHAQGIIEAAMATVSPNDDLIDRDLLMRILSNPKVLQQLLISNNSNADAALQPSHSTDIGINGGGAQTSKPQLNALPMPTAAAAAAPPQLRTGFAVSPSAPSPCMVKGISYYKSLIQQHGGGGGVVPPQSKRVMATRSRDDQLKSRVMKPCIYFNTSRGCKNGANCAFQHNHIDMLSSRKRVGCVTEVAAKRVKLGR